VALELDDHPLEAELGGEEIVRIQIEAEVARAVDAGGGRRQHDRDQHRGAPAQHEIQPTDERARKPVVASSIRTCAHPAPPHSDPSTDTRPAVSP
jgi:hypothetical protein